MTFLDVKRDKSIKSAYQIANTANYTLDELELQRKRKEFIYIQRNSIEKAKREGLEEGVIKTATMMIREFNLSIQEVSKKLDIPIDELRKYLK